MDLELLATLNRARAERRAVLTVADLASGERRLVRGDDVEADPLAAELTARLRSGRSGLVEVSGRRLFIAVHRPPTRLVLIGAVHVSQALAVMGRVAELDVTIVDPRTAFATPERFPGTPILAEWPQEALPRLMLDRYTALAALTHDAKIDDPALHQALASGCFYVGALGSRRTHAARCERLSAAGTAGEALGRIHAPIGLDIGAVSPAEIAVSILAEIVLAMRRKPTRAETAAEQAA